MLSFFRRVNIKEKTNKTNATFSLSFTTIIKSEKKKQEQTNS